MPQLEPEWGIHQEWVYVPQVPVQGDVAGVIKCAKSQEQVSLVAAQKVQTKTLNITMSLPSRTALATSQASALVGNILSFTSKCSVESGATAMLWCFMLVPMYFRVVKWDLVYLSISMYIKCRVPSINLPVLEFCPEDGTSMEDNISVAVTEIFPASYKTPNSESSVGLPLEPTRTMAKTSPDSTEFRRNIPNLCPKPCSGTSGPLPRTGTFQNSP